MLGTLPGEQIGGDESGLRLVGRCARVAAVGDAMLVVVVVVVDGEETVGDIAEMCVPRLSAGGPRISKVGGMNGLDSYSRCVRGSHQALYVLRTQLYMQNIVKAESARGQSRRVSRLHDDLKRKRTRKTR